MIPNWDIVQAQTLGVTWQLSHAIDLGVSIPSKRVLLAGSKCKCFAQNDQREQAQHLGVIVLRVH